MNKKIAWILVFSWMTLIFYFSAQVAVDSNSMSTGITQVVLRIINNIFKDVVSLEILNHFIRKFAHFFIYFILGILLKNALNYEDLNELKSISYPLMIGAIYAASDEFHQSFVLGRGPSIADVTIDSMGVLTGIILLNFIIQRKKVKK